MNHSAALAAASASAADCMKSPRSVAAQQNQRYTLKDPQAVHDAGSASTGFFTTALRPKSPAQTPRARRRPPNWPQTSKAFPHHRRAWRAPHTTLLNRATTASSCNRRPPPSRQRMAALALVDGSHTLLPQRLELRIELVRSTTAIVRRRVDRCAACAGESISQTSESRGGAGGRVLSHE